MILRTMKAADVAAVARILAASPQAAQWAVRELVQPSWPQTGMWVAEESGEVVGIVAARTAAREAEILNLAVAPAWRRQGVGKMLAKAAIDAVEAEGAALIFLEVRESNAEARALYAGLGFQETGRRKGYYPDPVEDALVLSRRRA